MAGESSDGIFSLEKELTCAICTDVLYQPLTLLDCLHTFCGSCLKEWFAWQAASASQSRSSASPYTCPSCRESVRGTKADWRLTTLLEGFLKANPGRAKTEKEKEELGKQYKAGEDVLPPVQAREGSDSEDERLLSQVREMSMVDVDPERAQRRRAERAARHSARGATTGARSGPEGSGRQRVFLTESRLREHDADEPHVEHQPSLRSLLSASDAGTSDLQEEILQSIYTEGLLDGIDIDSLTTEQEEELTTRIAEAYKRRQRRRDRSRNQERRSQTLAAGSSRQDDSQALSGSATTQSASSRLRPPVSRPHLFEQTLQEPSHGHGRSQSASSQRSTRSRRSESAAASTPAARSATVLSQQPSTENAQRAERTSLSTTGRSVTDPASDTMREEIRRLRSHSTNAGQEDRSLLRSQPSPSHLLEHHHPQTAESNISQLIPSSSPPAVSTDRQHAVRPAVSTAAFAPEALHDAPAETHPSLQCNGCGRPEVQFDLHYNCAVCMGGAFNLCQRCYRDGRGCNHWFGFGFRAYDRWYRSVPAQNSQGWSVGHERPHILSPRRYVKPANQDPPPSSDSRSSLQEGPFCESCSAFAKDLYWYCNICLEGAWGFCDSCVLHGRHCTHPLLAVAHVASIRPPPSDPAKRNFVNMPHFRPDTYVTMPVPTDCDICRRPISPNSTRMHCYVCNNGDYDVCNECYGGLVAHGKIAQANGLNGWRRCLQGHRMAVIGYQDSHESGHLRVTVREPVGGRAFKEDELSVSAQISPGGVPPDGGVGMRCLAAYNYWPKEGVADELAFPKNAEIREVEDKNGDWFWGVYAGQIGLFPSNHVRTV